MFEVWLNSVEFELRYSLEEVSLRWWWGGPEVILVIT